MQGEAITYNDYFNESSDEGSYIESSGENAASPRMLALPSSFHPPSLHRLAAPALALPPLTHLRHSLLILPPPSSPPPLLSCPPLLLTLAEEEDYVDSDFVTDDDNDDEDDDDDAEQVSLPLRWRCAHSQRRCFRLWLQQPSLVAAGGCHALP
eukprot:2790918-Rhodomonas_salina.1